MKNTNTYTAFDRTTLLFHGDLKEVVLNIKKNLKNIENSSILIFSDLSGKTLDFNFQGTERDVQRRLEVFVTEVVSNEISGPGRPKLGVVSREVSLLPRHWEWLATQRGGASATLRLLVEEARKKSSETITVKQMQERAYQVMSVLAGDLQDYEEALRALYKKNRKDFLMLTKNWPLDVKKYVIEISNPVFKES